MPYILPQDGNSVNFFGKKTADGNEAFMPTEKNSDINSFSIAAINIGTTATELKTAILKRKTVTIICDNLIYLGPDNTVTVNNGFPVAAGDRITFNLKHDNMFGLFAISNGSSNVRIIETD
jgi:hypothetical protein